MDGGTTWNTNLGTAINKCKELVDDESKITIDVVLCGSSQLEKLDSTKSSVGNMLRYDDISSYYTDMADVNVFYHAYPNVNFRHLFAPSGPVADGLDMLNFDNKTNTWPMQALGRSDSQSILELPEGTIFEALSYW